MAKGRKTGGGSRKGCQNKATIAAREAIARFVDDNANRLQGWLDEIAAKDPLMAYKCVMEVVEYHVPKLARTEITGRDGGAVVIQATTHDEAL